MKISIKTSIYEISLGLTRALCATVMAVISVQSTPLHAQQGKASPRERAGAVLYGKHCSTCHGVRLIKDDAAHDLAAAAKDMSEERFIAGAKTARGAMPSYASLLNDTQLADVYAYVKRGHSSDLDDVPMESNH